MNRGNDLVQQQQAAERVQQAAKSGLVQADALNGKQLAQNKENVAITQSQIKNQQIDRNAFVSQDKDRSAIQQQQHLNEQKQKDAISKNVGQDSQWTQNREQAKLQQQGIGAQLSQDRIQQQQLSKDQAPQLSQVKAQGINQCQSAQQQCGKAQQQCADAQCAQAQTKAQQQCVDAQCEQAGQYRQGQQQCADAQCAQTQLMGQQQQLGQAAQLGQAQSKAQQQCADAQCAQAQTKAQQQCVDAQCEQAGQYRQGQQQCADAQCAPAQIKAQQQCVDAQCVQNQAKQQLGQSAQISQSRAQQQQLAQGLDQQLISKDRALNQKINEYAKEEGQRDHIQERLGGIETRDFKTDMKANQQIAQGIQAGQYAQADRQALGAQSNLQQGKLAGQQQYAQADRQALGAQTYQQSKLASQQQYAQADRQAALGAQNTLQQGVKGQQAGISAQSDLKLQQSLAKDKQLYSQQYQKDQELSKTRDSDFQAQNLNLRG